MKRLSIAIMAASLLMTFASCEKSHVNDPTTGQTWEYNPDGNNQNATKSMQLLDKHGRPVTHNLDLYATTGFDGDVAFVAQCTQRDNANQCTETAIALMNEDGQLLNQFGEFYYPELVTYNSYPAFLINVAPDGIYRLYPSEQDAISIPKAGYKSVIFSDDRFLIEQGDLLGFIDRSGKLAILPSFIAAQTFIDGKALVVDKNGKLGTITADGMFYPEKFSCMLQLNQDYRFVNVGGQLARMADDIRINDKTFYHATSYHPDSESDFCLGGKWGIIDNQDRIVIPPEYENIQLGKYYHLGINEEGKFALIALDGKRLSNFIFEEIQAIADETGIIESEYLVAKHNGKWGVVRPNGEIVLPFEHEQLGPESEGFIAFRQGSKWGFMDLTGKVIFAPIYSEVQPFSSGRSQAILEGAPTNLYRDDTTRDVWLERDRLMQN